MQKKYMEENKQEIKAKQCKVCLIVQPAHFKGYRNDNKTKVWTNAQGQEWNGRCCASCQLVITRNNMKKLREKRRNGQE